MRDLITIVEDYTDQVELAALDFLRDHLECFDGMSALGNCSDVSKAFAARVPGAEVVRVSHYLGDPKRGYWRAHPSQFEHTLVRVGDRYIDLTARQFDRAAPVPRFLTQAELEREWAVIRD